MFTPLPDGRIKLDEPLESFVWIAPGISFQVTVPRDFKSDGASIPRCFWWFVGPPIRDRHLIPSIVHDFLCKTATSYQERILSDAVFRILLKTYDVPLWKRIVMYAGVRTQGLITWSKRAWHVLAVAMVFLLLFGLLGAGPEEATPQHSDDPASVILKTDGQSIKAETGSDIPDASQYAAMRSMLQKAAGWPEYDAQLKDLSKQLERGELENNMRAIPGKPLPEPRIVLGSCKYHETIDGDTADIAITRIVRVRFVNCWAPENHSTRRHVSEKTLGLEVEAALNRMVSPGDACRLVVLPDGDEKFGDQITFSRVVGALHLEDGDGRSLSEILNAKRLTFKTKEELEDYLTERDKDERFVE